MRGYLVISVRQRVLTIALVFATVSVAFGSDRYRFVNVRALSGEEVTRLTDVNMRGQVTGVWVPAVGAWRVAVRWDATIGLVIVGIEDPGTNGSIANAVNYGSDKLRFLSPVPDRIPRDDFINSGRTTTGDHHGQKSQSATLD